MYCGDHEHYGFLKEAFGLFAHQNALQRDMCPSATRFEGEIIAMALELFNAGAVEDEEPAGIITSGGTMSITHAMLAYREEGREARGIERPNVVKPETGTSGVRQGVSPVRRRAPSRGGRSRDHAGPGGHGRGADR